MICRECGTEMYLDEKSKCLEDCYDMFWSCKKCYSECIEEVILNQTYREIWSSDQCKKFETYSIVHSDFKNLIDKSGVK